MPQIKPPAPEPMPKPKVKSQRQKVLDAIKAGNGVTNKQLSLIALKYTSVISDLRKDGHSILAVRQQRADGSMGFTFRYYYKGHRDE